MAKTYNLISWLLILQVIALTNPLLNSTEPVKALASESRFLATRGSILPAQASAIATGPLTVNTNNGRYFTDGSGKAIYLTGSHTWSNFQDNGGGYPPPVFNYNAYLDFLIRNNHNFFRLWTWEQSRWTAETSDNNYWFYPEPSFQRTGPGNALDGKPKFDLTRFNQPYFDRLRQRVIQAGDRGIYVSIMLFNGWSVDPKAPWGGGRNIPWKGHPFNVNNNINSINGDPNGDNSGIETETLGISAITALQDAYVKKVIDTVNDLDNVLYEICNECADGTWQSSDSTQWQYHMVDLIHQYEAGKPKQHPVGMTAISSNDANLFASNADWISLNNGGSLIPPVANGTKVILLDTDHMCGSCVNHAWIWEAFTQGHNPIFMDPYDGAGYGVGGAGFVFNDPWAIDMRMNLGYTMAYANRMNLAAMTPQPSLCSSGYCLASTTEYLAYFPGGGSVTINLSATEGDMSAEWLNPENGRVIDIKPVAAGKVQSLTPPFEDDAVLYIYKTEKY